MLTLKDAFPLSPHARRNKWILTHYAVHASLREAAVSPLFTLHNETLNVWTGCYQGSWQADVARFTRENGTVVVSGPYYITTSAAPHFTWEQMYAVDLANFTGGNSSTAMQHVSGGEICAWDDAAGTDSGDLSIQISPYIFGVAEAWWSPQALTSGKAPDAMRAHHQRCRLGQRGFATHPFYAFGTFCPMEYEVPVAAI